MFCSKTFDCTVRPLLVKRRLAAPLSLLYVFSDEYHQFFAIVTDACKMRRWMRQVFSLHSYRYECNDFLENFRMLRRKLA